MILTVLATAGCSGGSGPSRAERTATAEALAQRATATAVAAALPPVLPSDVANLIRAGFVNVNIPFDATLIDSFREEPSLLGILDDCAQARAQGIARDDQSFWPAVLGDCYTVGDATKWLFDYTHKPEFAYANQLAMRYMRQKLDEANANGAQLGEDYWQLVVGKIYTLTSRSTPIAATPLVQITATPQ